MIKIVKADEVILQNNLIITVYGSPGAGKTSLGFSANKPLLLDFDLGAQRSIGRKDAIVINKWNDIADITAKDLESYETIVIDTVGRLLEVLTAHLIAGNPKLARSTGELQLHGYGALNVAFKTFLMKIKSFGKDIILIAHNKEEKENDITFTRIDAMGSSKQEILKCSDLLGYVAMKGNDRELDFNPTEQHLGKNCAGFPSLKIPAHTSNQNFLAELIQQAKDKMNAKTAEQIKKEQVFNAVIDMINCAIEPEEFTTLIQHVKNDQALKSHLHKTATETKGYKFNVETKSYYLERTPAVNEMQKDLENLEATNELET